jgi:hypothetical protein
MNDKKLDQIIDELTAIKKLLIVFLQHQDVKGGIIANALGVSGGRVSQMAPTRKNKKKKELLNG